MRYSILETTARIIENPRAINQLIDIALPADLTCEWSKASQEADYD